MQLLNETKIDCRRWLVRVGMLSLAATLMACSYSPNLPPQPFLCGSETQSCPEGYACVTDGTRRVCAAATSAGLDARGSTDAATLDASQDTCAHDICTNGVKLVDSCNACVTEICATDNYCCVTKWSSTCVNEVASICNQTCP